MARRPDQDHDPTGAADAPHALGPTRPASPVDCRIDGITVLGGVRVWRDGRDVTPTGRLPVRLLAALTVRAPAPTSGAELIEIGWAGNAPDTAASALRTHLSRVRASITGDLAATAAGYALERVDLIDLTAYRAALSSARAHRHDPPARLRFLEEALDLWGGRPWGELADQPPFASHAHALEEGHRMAEEEWGSLVHSLGLAGEHLDELWRQAASEPLREQRWANLIVALRSEDRVSEALAAYESACSTLADQLGSRPGATLRAAYDSLFQWQEPSTPAVPRARTAPVGPLIGRAEDIGHLEASLVRGDPVTLVGIGGIGKTRMAVEVAARMRSRGGRAWMLEVPPTELAPRLTRELALQIAVTAPTERDAEDALLARMAALDLLVLDAADGCPAEVTALLGLIARRRPTLQVLVTARRPLGVPGEVAIPLHPLRVPGPDEPWEDTAIALLAQSRGRAASDPEARAELLDDCRSTGGVPLLLVLAGHSGPARAGIASDQERVAGTALELIDDLEAPTRHLATAMATLPGGLSGDLAARLLATSQRDADRRLRHLAWLGLTHRRASPHLAVHHLLDPVRDAVLDRVGTDATRAAKAALTDHLVDIGHRVRPSLAEPPAMDSMVEFDTLDMNLRSLLDRREDRFIAVAAGAADFLGCRGHAGEAVTWLADEIHDTDPLRAATVALTAGRIGRLGANLVAVTDDLVRAVRAFDEEGDQASAAFAALYGAIGRSYQGRIDDAEALLNESRPPASPAWEWVCEHFDLTAGWLKILRGQWEHGVAQIEAVAARLETVDPFGASLANFLLAACLFPDPDRVRRQLPHARAIAESIGDVAMVASTTMVEADLLGDSNEAIPALRAAAAAFDAAGLPERAAVARVRAGTLIVSHGSAEAARHDFLAAVAPLERSRSVSTLVALAGLARSFERDDLDLATSLAHVCRTDREYLNGYLPAAFAVKQADALLGDLGVGAVISEGPEGALPALLDRAHAAGGSPPS